MTLERQQPPTLRVVISQNVLNLLIRILIYFYSCFLFINFFEEWFFELLYEFAKSHAMRAMPANVVYVTTCQRAKSVPTSHFYLLTCQRRANFSTSLTKMRINFSKEFLFFNFLIMLHICKFLEYLSNCRKFNLAKQRM